VLRITRDPPKGILHAFVRTALKLNEIGVGESVGGAPRMSRGCTRRERTGRMGQETVNCGMDRWTGMHRPWGDFCVYRSALTRESRASSGAPRERGLSSLLLCLLLLLLLPFLSFSCAPRRPSRHPVRSVHLAGQGSDRALARAEKTVISTPSRSCDRNPISRGG